MQALPANPRVEAISKSDVLDRLKEATRRSGKGTYHKGAHAARILEKLERVRGDVFRHRPVLKAFDWPLMLWRALAMR